MESIVTVDEFKTRLVQLCLKGSAAMPRRYRDRQILLKSITLILDPGRIYSEADINNSLVIWLKLVARSSRIDHVSLRRWLVDEGYLSRDKAGTKYWVTPGFTTEPFSQDVNRIDPIALIEAAYRETEERKRKFLQQRNEK